MSLSKIERFIQTDPLPGSWGDKIDVRPNWKEQPPSGSLTGKQWCVERAWQQDWATFCIGSAADSLDCFCSEHCLPLESLLQATQPIPPALSLRGFLRCRCGSVLGNWKSISLHHRWHRNLEPLIRVADRSAFAAISLRAVRVSGFAKRTFAGIFAMLYPAAARCSGLSRLILPEWNRLRETVRPVLWV
jgi:hypothetical protein